MTSRQRMQAVLSGRLPDRVPFFPTIYIDHACVASGRRFEEAIINPALAPRAMLDAAIRYRTDVVRFVLGPDAAWYRDKAVETRDGRLVQISRTTGKAEGIFDVEGGGRLIPFEPAPPVRSLEEVRAIPVPAADDYLEGGYLKDVLPCIEEAHARDLFVVGMCSSQTLNFMVEKLGNPETALLSFYDDPDLAHALIDKATSISIEKARACVKAGADCIFIGDSYASASVISPATYETFCAPAYVRTAREVHQTGVFCYKHCCGNYNPLLEFLPAIGIDAMDGIDPTSGMSVKHTKEKIGARLTLMGGLSCLTLLQGTVDFVTAEARQCVLDGKPGGRYVLGSACAVPRFTPPENMLAARQAAIDFGTY